MPTDSSQTIDQLRSINQKILAEGETLPTVRLKDGSQVQTGTVATMLHNVAQYNAGARGDIERELELSIPTLLKVGLFDLFTPDEWIDGDNAGRRFIGQKALDYLKAAEHTGY